MGVTINKKSTVTDPALFLVNVSRYYVTYKNVYFLSRIALKMAKLYDHERPISQIIFSCPLEETKHYSVDFICLSFGIMGFIVELSNY